MGLLNPPPPKDYSEMSGFMLTMGTGWIALNIGLGLALLAFLLLVVGLSSILDGHFVFLPIFILGIPCAYFAWQILAFVFAKPKPPPPPLDIERILYGDQPIRKMSVQETRPPLDETDQPLPL